MVMLQRHTLIYVALFITSILANNGYYRNADTDLHLGNLGTVISRRVAHQMYGMAAQLNQHLASMNSNFQKQMSTMKRQLKLNMEGIKDNVHDRLSGLKESIEHRVEQSLQPVKALEIKSSMARGIGGLTIVLYGGVIEHIVTDGNIYTCDGEMIQDSDSDAGVRCTTDLVFYAPDYMDVCTETSYSRVNNLYCFGNSASFVCVDGACQCREGVMHTLDDLQNICGIEYGTKKYVKYDYYPNRQNKNQIPVPHPNKYVRCENADEDHCVWHGVGFLLPMGSYNITFSH